MATERTCIGSFLFLMGVGGFVLWATRFEVLTGWVLQVVGYGSTGCLIVGKCVYSMIQKIKPCGVKANRNRKNEK